MKRTIVTIALLVAAMTGAAAQKSQKDTSIINEKDNSSLMESISNGVVNGYNAIENGTVNGYMKIQDGIVSGWNKLKDKCIDVLFKKEGETTEEAEIRLKNMA